MMGSLRLVRIGSCSPFQKQACDRCTGQSQGEKVCVLLSCQGARLSERREHTGLACPPPLCSREKQRTAHSEENLETFQPNLSSAPSSREDCPLLSLLAFEGLRRQTPERKDSPVQKLNWIALKRLCLPTAQYFIIRKWDSKFFPTKEERWRERGRNH